ncbi:hypothetical protein FO519_006523 [Halicephalobus sp. NKZ332]|nr:hypothetical protein FO519_006523 [Halicephalobus sp. NKZ332]
MDVVDRVEDESLEGTPVEMQVVATGWPTPTVKWFKNGEEIKSDVGEEARRTIWTDERGVHHCVIINTKPEDEGDYSVVATNPLGEARTEGPLSIIRPRYPLENGDEHGMPFPPGFIRQLKNKHVFTHMPTIFDCLVVGHPPPTVDWYHNGKKIVPDGRTKIQVAGGGSHALLIMDTTLEDAGEYVAIARNSHGTAQSSAILDVTVPHLDNIKFDGSFDVTPYLTEEYGFKRINYKSLPTPPDRGPFIKEVTGHYLTLSWIPTKRSPPRYPQVTYVIEIRELPDRDWTLLDYNIPEPVCKVRNLELGKSYQFRVRAENIYGISDPSPASPPSRLMAPPPPVLDKNKKIIPLLDPYTEKYLDQAYAEQYACAPWFAPGVVEKRYCAETDTISIGLSFSGYPDPKIQWKFRGWDVDTTSPTTNIKVHNYAGAETVLTISGFQKENAGQYQCFATNQYGEAQQNIMIELAERPRFIQPLLDRTFSDGKPMKLDVRVEGSPFPELKWMKDWKPVVESHRIKFVQDGPYLCSMIVSNPIWRDSGIYSVIAINDAGQSTTSCTVTVEADGEYNDVQLPRKKVNLESRKIKDVYEIDSSEEKKAPSGAPFLVKDKKTQEFFIAQLKPLDDNLKRGIGVHNILDHPGFVQYRHVIAGPGSALVVYENADSYLFENLLHPGTKQNETVQRNREEEVRIFVKQLLTALQYMHHRNIVHLDLRPEVVLLQDDHLKLADFGQSRHLLAGRAHGEIHGSPEFVAPEVAKGELVTLAADMWSVGVLTYILLSGSSPFLGDNDDETISNVIRGEANFQVPELNGISPEAKDFLKNLIQIPQVQRMSVDQALIHDWLNDPGLSKAKLSTDCLREWRYSHKWLAPAATLARSQSGHAPQQTEPFAVYDYLRIKDVQQPPEVPDYDRKGRPQRPASRSSASPTPEQLAQYFPPGYFPPPEYFDPRGFVGDSRDPGSRGDPRGLRDPRDPRDLGFRGDPRDPRSQSPGDPNSRRSPRSGSNPRDPFGGRIPTPEELKKLIEQHLPPGVKYPPGVKPEDLLFVLPPPYGQIPGGNQPQGGMPLQQRPRAVSGSPQTERKLQPQEKGETPTQNGFKQKKSLEDQEPESQPPIRLVRGERRDIEEEIANRILSDISEENSVAGSVASVEEIEPMWKLAKEKKPKSSSRRSRSRSNTPLAEDSEGSNTPLASPTPMNGSEDPLKKFFGDKVPYVPEFNDPSVPVGAPVFIDGLGKAVMTIDPNTGKAKASLSPRPKSGTPGTKSPVMISPGREHKMEVVIATKRGRQGRSSPMRDSAHPLKKKGDGEDDDEEVGPKTARRSIHFDPDFDDLMNEVDRLKKKYKTVDDDLDKYRPKHFYKEQDLDLHREEEDIDDYPWESDYQIGPDTLLLATRGPEFNARVRDYRRELWGDGASLVRQGYLGYRNQDITVRERRRYTDLIREDPEISKTVKQTVQNSEVFQNGAMRRVKTTNVISVPSAVKKNPDGTFGAIFRSRLRDVPFAENAGQLSFSCYVIGNPPPEVTWFHHDKLLVEDGRHRIHREGDKCTLNILRPTLADIGDYSCHAINEHGKDTCSGRLVTGEIPGRTGRPEIELSSDSEVLLTWEPPESNTFLEGITYKVEARPAGDDDYFAKWTTISDNVDDEAALIKHLAPQGIYQFRVTAKNGFGWGIPSLTSRIIRTHPRGAPKLQQDFLRDQLKFTIITMPVRKHKKDPGLTEISEEAEEEASEEELSADDSVTSLSKESRPLNLETSEDPLSRFQLENEIFKGMYTIVRNAVDTKALVTKHVVAKVRIQSKEHPAKLSEEFEALKAAQHENVVTLFAAYERNNTLLLFTERLYEGIFDRFCYPDYYNEEQVALSMRQLTAALHWIHFKGVIHMDVQPDNVMFANKRSWVVKLIDFEEAQFVDSDIIKKRKPVNPEWAAPELLQPDGIPTVQTDVWGMGVICFTLLSGFHPFSDEGETPEEVREAVCKQKCDPNLIPVQASQEALRFATWAIKKNPNRRIRTDEALAHRWLSNDKQITRRREGVKYPSNRLRRTTLRTLRRPFLEPDDTLANNYGAKRR